MASSLRMLTNIRTRSATRNHVPVRWTLQRWDACNSGSPCPAQLDQRIHRSGQQKRRRIETRHGTSEVHRTYCSAEDCSGRMSQSVSEQRDREKVEQRSNPPRSPKYERRQGQQDKNCHDQSGQPFPKLEGRHRPKPQPRSQRHNSGVVHSKETSGSLVGDVRRQCQAQQNPRYPQLGGAWRSSDWCGNTHHSLFNLIIHCVPARL
jgi:hypothetical protein